METPEQSRQRWVIRRTITITSFIYVLALFPAYAVMYAMKWIDVVWITSTAPVMMLVVPALVGVVLKYIHDATKDDIERRKEE